MAQQRYLLMRILLVYQAFALAIMTADCVPVMIATDAADDNKLIAAIHAGWQV
ncbi:MAG: laccase domain-containing protein [Moraxella osloensis]